MTFTVDWALNNNYLSIYLYVIMWITILKVHASESLSKRGGSIPEYPEKTSDDPSGIGIYIKEVEIFWHPLTLVMSLLGQETVLFRNISIFWVDSFSFGA